MVDRNALLEDLDVEAYADFLGIEKKKRGAHTFIRCPGHLARQGKSDRHISNALLSGKGYYCFTCGKYVNAIDMTEEVLGCSFKKAAETISTFTGKSFYSPAERNPKRCPLSREDLRLIGLDKGNHKPRAYTGVSETDGEKIGLGEYLRYESAYISMGSLYAEDPEAYTYLIGGKAFDTYKRLRMLIMVLDSGGIYESFFEKISGTNAIEAREGVISALKDLLNRVENIICTLNLKASPA